MSSFLSCFNRNRLVHSPIFEVNQPHHLLLVRWQISNCILHGVYKLFDLTFPWCGILHQWQRLEQKYIARAFHVVHDQLLKCCTCSPTITHSKDSWVTSPKLPYLLAPLFTLLAPVPRSHAKAFSKRGKENNYNNNPHHDKSNSQSHGSSAKENSSKNVLVFYLCRQPPSISQASRCWGDWSIWESLS